MAQFTSVNIKINGNPIKQFTSLSLTQSIFEHHSFRLVCPTESIDSATASTFNASKNLIGCNFLLQITAVEAAGNLQFAGVVTQVETARHDGYTGDIIISGYSPTIFCDNGPHCKSWEKKTIKVIADDVLGHFPKNLLKPDISPLYAQTLSYAVQYKETAWQFISRLCATYGEWFFYNGKQVIIGAPKGEEVKLVYGGDLSVFNMMMQVRPVRFQNKAYDFINGHVYDSTPKGIPGKAGLNDLGQFAYQKSEEFFGAQPKEYSKEFVTSQQQVDVLTDMRAVTQSSNMVRFNGSSGHAGVQVGGCISVHGKNIFSLADESFGKYTVISVNHYCDGEGNYTNDFVAIPASLKYPPVANFVEPHCETQSALVTDNHDVEGMGRIRVRFHWMKPTEKTPWLRQVSAHGGSNKGFFFKPEIGEEVIVGFEGDSPTKPYVIGTVCNSKARNAYSNSGNDIKAIQTRSDTKIVINDKDGSIYISDAKGNFVMMDGKGNIKVTSSDSIVFTCGKSKIEIKKDGAINIIGNRITTTAQEKAKMVSGGASFTADGQGGVANMEGAKSNVTGSEETKIKGGVKTEVISDNNVEVKAAFITFNSMA